MREADAVRARGSSGRLVIHSDQPDTGDPINFREHHYPGLEFEAVRGRITSVESTSLSYSLAGGISVGQSLDSLLVFLRHRGVAPDSTAGPGDMRLIACGAHREHLLIYLGSDHRVAKLKLAEYGL